MPDEAFSAFDREIATGVDPLAKIFARLEMRYVLSGQCYGFAGLRVAAYTGRPEMQRKAAKPTNLNALASRERIAHQIQQVLNCQLNVLRRQVLLLPGDHFNEF